MPTQNPDGRDANRRQNEYGFDLNRDWFARTQPETDGKIELLRTYPPQVFVDAHEMGGRRVLLPAERRPDPPRDRRRAGRLDQPDRRRPTRPRFGLQRCLHRHGHHRVLLQLRRLRPVLHGVRRHRAGHRLRRRRHDLREGQRVGGRRTGCSSSSTPSGRPLGWASANKREVLNGYFKIWTDALAEGTAGTLEPNEVVQPDQHGAVPGAGHQDQVVLPAARPSARRRAPAGRATARDGRRGLRGQGADHRAATRGSSAVVPPRT